VRGPRLIHLWGPSPIAARKKMESRKSENDALKIQSVKNSKSKLECPRSLRLLLPLTQKRSIARNCWNPTWLAGTGLLTATGKPTEIATIEIFDKTYGLRFLWESHLFLLIFVQKKKKQKNKQTRCIYIVGMRLKDFKVQREDHVATPLPRM